MIIIGEKINATIPSVRPLIDERNGEALAELAQKQAAAGATYIDVNVGTGKGTREDEIDTMRWAVEAVGKAVDKPLCIDSADAAVLDAGLAARGGAPALINSTKAEEKVMAEILPLAAKYEAPVVGLAMDENGIPMDVAGRMAACAKIVAGCEKYGVPLSNVFFDPLVLPVSTDDKQGLVTLETVRSIKEKYPEAKTTMGLSNVSYGLPGRAVLNAAFLHMALFAGLDGAIMDPLNETMMKAVRAGEALVGKDRHFRRYTRAFRKQ